MNRFPLIILTLLSATQISLANVVKGITLSAEDDKPVIGAMVEVVVDSMPVESVRTGNKGDFSFSLKEKSNSCTISINISGYTPQSISIMNLSEDTDLGKIYLSPSATLLDEVEVLASSSRVIGLPDKNIVFPTRTEKERATNPLNLLAQISFAAPSLTVDEYGKSMKIGGADPQILINGIKRNYSDFNALDPEDILKIEYITHEDIRYGAPYINIVTARPPTGGYFLTDISAPVSTLQENHQIYASYRKGRHEVSVNYSGLFRDSRKEHHDATERYFYPGGTITYELEGLPSRILDRNHRAAVEYTLTGGAKKMIVVTAAIDYHSQDSHFNQSCSGMKEDFHRMTAQDSRTLNPSLMAYGSLPVADNGRLELNLTGAYQSGDFSRGMTQSDGYSEATLTSSHSYSLGADLYYEHLFSWSKLNVGLSQTYTDASNDYTVEGKPSRQDMEKSRTSAYAALSGQIGNIGYYYASAGLVHTKVEKGFTTPYAYLSFKKKLGDFDLSYAFRTSSSSPVLSTYSDVVLPVNEILYQEGNMLLKDELSVRNHISASYSRGKFSAEFEMMYQTSSNTPVTICRYVDNPSDPLHGKFIQTTENSRRSNKFGTTLSMGLSNLDGHYSLMVFGTYMDQSTRWESLRWKKSYFRAGGYAAAYFGHWQFNLQLGLMPSYPLAGNIIWRNYTSWSAGASWHKGNWTLSCTVADLFNRKSFYQEMTIMAVGSITESRSWIGDKNNWISFGVRYQFGFGKTAEKPNRNISGNTRVDSGVSVDY